MRTLMRVLIVLALPGVVFGWLTRLPPLRFDTDLEFFTPEVGWIDVLAALIVVSATSLLIAVVIAVLVIVLLGLGIGTDQRVRPR